MERNRVKRRLRELVRTRLLADMDRIDLLIRAKPDAYNSNFQQLADDVGFISRWLSTMAPVR